MKVKSEAFFTLFMELRLAPRFGCFATRRGELRLRAVSSTGPFIFSGSESSCCWGITTAAGCGCGVQAGAGTLKVGAGRGKGGSGATRGNRGSVKRLRATRNLDARSSGRALSEKTKLPRFPRCSLLLSGTHQGAYEMALLFTGRCGESTP